MGSENWRRTYGDQYVSKRRRDGTVAHTKPSPVDALNDVFPHFINEIKIDNTIPTMDSIPYMTAATMYVFILD
jgi:hypothetical protein